MNITGTLPSEKLPIFFLKPNLGLDPRDQFREGAFLLEVAFLLYSFHWEYPIEALRNMIIMYCLINEQECFIRFKATSAQREWL